jgi:hypothetical protein
VRYVRPALNLALLAPKIVEAIAAGNLGSGDRDSLAEREGFEPSVPPTAPLVSAQTAGLTHAYEVLLLNAMVCVGSRQSSRPCLLWDTRESPRHFALEWSFLLDSRSHPVDDEF